MYDVSVAKFTDLCELAAFRLSVGELRNLQPGCVLDTWGRVINHVWIFPSYEVGTRLGHDQYFCLAIVTKLSNFAI